MVIIARDTVLAMSEENVEIARRMADAYARGDIEAWLAPFDPDVEFDASSSRPEGGVYHGPRGVEEGVQVWIERWIEYRFEVEEIIDAGENVLAGIREFGRVEQSRAEISKQTFWVMTFRNGKIVRAELFSDRNRALKASGLRE